MDVDDSAVEHGPTDDTVGELGGELAEDISENRLGPGDGLR